MIIIINGKAKEISNNTKLKELLNNFQVNLETSVIDYNDEIYKSTELDRIVLKENDQINVIGFVGGG